MGKRDLVNPWGHELPPVIVIGRSRPRELTVKERKHFDAVQKELEALEMPYVVDGQLVEPSDDEGDGFMRRMTGF